MDRNKKFNGGSQLSDTGDPAGFDNYVADFMHGKIASSEASDSNYSIITNHIHTRETVIKENLERNVWC